MILKTTSAIAVVAALAAAAYLLARNDNDASSAKSASGAPSTESTSTESTVQQLTRGGPIRYEPKIIRGPAKIPADLPFGMMCDLEGEIQSGNWKLRGTVTATDPDSGLITFETEAFRVGDELRQAVQTGRLAYKLPHGLTIQLSAGDPITLLHNHATEEKRPAWDIQISSGRTLIFATSHRHDDTPPKSAELAEVLFANSPGDHAIFFWSNPSDDDLEQDVRTIGKHTAPVSFRVNDGPHVDAGIGGVANIELDGATYHFVVLSNEHYRNPEADHGPGGVHGDEHSHAIECFIVRAAE